MFCQIIAVLLFAIQNSILITPISIWACQAAFWIMTFWYCCWMISILSFPEPKPCFAIKKSYPRSGDGRPIPGLQIRDGKIVLRIAPRDLTIVLDDRIDAYSDLIYAPGQLQPERSRLGRSFQKADEEAIPLPRVSRKVFSAGHEGVPRPRMAISRAVSCLILRMVAAILV